MSSKEFLGYCKLCGKEITEENIDKHFGEYHTVTLTMQDDGLYWLVQD